MKLDMSDSSVVELKRLLKEQKELFIESEMASCSLESSLLGKIKNVITQNYNRMFANYEKILKESDKVLAVIMENLQEVHEGSIVPVEAYKLFDCLYRDSIEEVALSDLSQNILDIATLMKSKSVVNLKVSREIFKLRKKYSTAFTINSNIILALEHEVNSSRSEEEIVKTIENSLPFLLKLRSSFPEINKLNESNKQLLVSSLKRTNVDNSGKTVHLDFSRRKTVDNTDITFNSLALEVKAGNPKLKRILIDVPSRELVDALRTLREVFLEESKLIDSLRAEFTILAENRFIAREIDVSFVSYENSNQIKINQKRHALNEYSRYVILENFDHDTLDLIEEIDVISSRHFLDIYSVVILGHMTTSNLFARILADSKVVF